MTVASLEPYFIYNSIAHAPARRTHSPADHPWHARRRTPARVRPAGLRRGRRSQGAGLDRDPQPHRALRPGPLCQRGLRPRRPLAGRVLKRAGTLMKPARAPDELSAVPAIPRPPMSERMAIADTVTGMLHAIDALDWKAVRSALADRVEMDYTSLFGGKPSIQNADDLVLGWQGLVPGFQATQHLLGPILVRSRRRGGDRRDPRPRLPLPGRGGLGGRRALHVPSRARNRLEDRGRFLDDLLPGGNCQAPRRGPGAREGRVGKEVVEVVKSTVPGVDIPLSLG